MSISATAHLFRIRHYVHCGLQEQNVVDLVLAPCTIHFIPATTANDWSTCAIICRTVMNSTQVFDVFYAHLWRYNPQLVP